MSAHSHAHKEHDHEDGDDHAGQGHEHHHGLGGHHHAPANFGKAFASGVIMAVAAVGIVLSWIASALICRVRGHDRLEIEIG